ncbi:putative tail fiber protein [Haloarcula virus HCTV-8]|uniref:Tail fiber protein n=3 Tax=Haloferacalesvirus hv5 TaxID=1273753 RepID=A0AAE9BW74_9CAUD|nr:putative tail fiber protein [Haloarcula phage HCTV-7]UBF20472.1 putative tail fiber protein [Haloarcula phage HCTV-9]UBF20588.1 putative tail fiber protein [Haloarcula phage HCTV-11]UBF20930.1 putative tail fiber protein [Haloarcula virus HCTV-8]UBF21042.1 putative tail fiber protein [Haloarcula virus HCTV-10]
MAYTSKLKEWGAVADERSEFPDGYRYTKENPPVTHYDNFLVHNLIEDVQHLVDLTNAIDPDNDGQVADAETLQGKAPEQLGGFKFIQSGNPAEDTSGTTWFKNTNHLLFVADGEDYDIFPETGYDETSDFSGSEGFSLTHETPARTRLDAGSLKLINEQVVADFESGISPNHAAWSWSDTSGISHTGTRAEITSNGDATTPQLQRDVPVAQDFEFSFEVSEDTANINDESIIRLDDENGNRELEIQFNDGAGNVSLSDGTELLPSWTAGQTYVFEVDPDFDAGSLDVVIDGQTIISGRPMDATAISNIWFGSKTTDSGSVRSVFVDNVHTGAREYGEVVVSCPEPDSRIEGWDLLRFTRTFDGESVVVDVEDETGTTLVSDIQSNEDLSAAVGATTNPQIRVKFTRADTANNPSFDSLYRRWVLRPGDNGVNIRAFGSGGEDNVHEINFTAPVTKDGDGRVTVDLDPRYVNVTGDSMSGDLDVNASVSVGDDLVLDDDDGAQYVVVGKDSDTLTIAEQGGSAFEQMEVNARKLTKQGHKVWHDGNMKEKTNRRQFISTRLATR